MTSIRRTLLMLLLGVVTAAVAVGAVVTYRVALTEADAMFDYHLRQLALSLRDQAFANAFEPNPELDPDEFDFVVQVRDAAGVRLYLSPPPKVLPPRGQLGFSPLHTREGGFRGYAQMVRGPGGGVATAPAGGRRVGRAPALTTVPAVLAPFPPAGPAGPRWCS